MLLASSSVSGEWFQGLTDPADDALPLRDNWQIAPKMGTMTASLENVQEKPVGEEIDSKPTGGWTTIFSSAIVINWTKLTAANKESVFGPSQILLPSTQYTPLLRPIQMHKYN